MSLRESAHHREEAYYGQAQEHPADRRLGRSTRPRRRGDRRRRPGQRLEQQLEQRPGGGSAGSGLPPQRSDEQLLTGDTAAKVRQAALAQVSGGTVERVETDADGNAAYEAHMRKADGSRVTVYVNKSSDVVSIESGP